MALVTISLRLLAAAFCMHIVLTSTAIELPSGHQIWEDYLPFSAARDNEIHRDLGGRLSPEAKIFTAESAAFRNSILRWQEHRAPGFQASVEVRTENDIRETILYATANDIPFMATSGKHGDMSTLQELRAGIQIDLRALDKVEVSADGDHALIGGGIRQKALISALASKRKRTVTGVCECVGIGAALGGGHGFLQGQYGLMADQVVQWRMVLANGSAITVSRDVLPDLFWAMNGAGANFGVVTEIKMKIYDLGSSHTWNMESFVFTGDHVEDLYSMANDLFKTQPPGASHFSYWMLNPEIDARHPVIAYNIFYDGPAEALQAYAAPLHTLNPIKKYAAPVAFMDMSAVMLSSEKDPGCAKGGNPILRFPIDLETYNATAMRRAFNLTARMFQEEPSFSQTLIAVDSFAVQGVKAIDERSTAYPWRKDNILVSPFLFIDDPDRIDLARKFGEEFRQLLHEGTGRNPDEMHSYVNYAYGNEGMGGWYGHEEWRLEKLRRLKREYDPRGRFSWFAPITEHGEKNKDEL